mmetsp:Transcript_8280/g.18382  ORF Transcript_8280/g.18382 Transcript_8280/m.18382 type:complete len:379 (+) Transcript_8280:152-1288(+)
MLSVRSPSLSLGLVIITVSLGAASSSSWLGSTSPAALRLRGGQAYPQAVIASTLPKDAALAAGAASDGKTGKDHTAFTKIQYKVAANEIYKTVEVAGSWSNFKNRIPMQKAPSGDWEVLTQLPVGYHEVKFVLNEKDWRCHPDLPFSTDKQGFQNNVIHVSDIPGRAPPSDKVNAAPKADTGVFTSSQDSISLAREMVKALEEENHNAKVKLAKAHSQLVNTMKQELTEALVALDKAKKHVAVFVEQGAAGLLKIKEAGNAKMTEIKAHMSKIRQILEGKESVALESINTNMAQRVKTLETEMAIYNKISPEIQELIDGAKLALTTITRDPNGFVNTAQELIPKIEAMTRKATQLAPPTADASFDHLHLNLTPVGGAE